MAGTSRDPTRPFGRTCATAAEKPTGFRRSKDSRLARHDTPPRVLQVGHHGVVSDLPSLVLPIVALTGGAIAITVALLDLRRDPQPGYEWFPATIVAFIAACSRSS